VLNNWTNTVILQGGFFVRMMKLSDSSDTWQNPRIYILVFRRQICPVNESSFEIWVIYFYSPIARRNIISANSAHSFICEIGRTHDYCNKWHVRQQGLPDGIVSNQKIPIWVNSGGSCTGKCWYTYFMAIWSNPLRLGIFYGHFVYFTVVWYIFTLWYVVSR
jgi:hypothetical protein